MHPKNKRERVKVAKKKGYKRSEALVSPWSMGGRKTKDEYRETVELFARHHRNTTKRCGGACCANPREHFGETIKEREHYKNFKQQLSELGYEEERDLDFERIEKILRGYRDVA